MDDLIITVFCEIDNFCKEYYSHVGQRGIGMGSAEPLIELKSSLSLSEVMAICTLFHHSGFRTFKWYYTRLVAGEWKKFFPRLVSYNRFAELMPFTAMPLALFTHSRRGKCTGISFVDSTTLDVCDCHRIPQHKVFKGLAQRGKSSTGWFYGFKLHLAINDRGEILAFCLTAGNIDDRNADVMERLTREMCGKLFADKGYVSRKLFESLWEKGIQLVTKLKKNAKDKLPMRLSDRILLRKRAVIESVNDFLKNICQIEHSRHRSFHNFVVNLISGIAAYTFLPKKPSIQFGNATVSG